jgi:hypothetical protein
MTYAFVVLMPRDAATQRAVWGGDPLPDPWWTAYRPVGWITVAADGLPQALERAWVAGQNDFAPGPSWNPLEPTRSLAVGDVLVPVSPPGPPHQVAWIGFQPLASIAAGPANPLPPGADRQDLPSD